MSTSAASSPPVSPATLPAGAAVRTDWPRFTERTRGAARSEYMQLRLDNRIGRGDSDGIGKEGRGGSLDLRFVRDPNPDFPLTTACWFIDKKKKQSVICLGEEIGRGLAADKEKLGAYAQAFIRHEGGHDRWTSRDYPGVVESAAKRGISPRDVNIWEDARIEHKARREWNTSFKWRDFEDRLEMTPKQPYSVLQSYIFNEGHHATVRADAKKDGIPDAMLATVRQFYKEGCRVRRTEDLVDVAVRFRKAFEPEWDEGKSKAQQNDPGKSGSPGDAASQSGSAGSPGSPSSPPPAPGATGSAADGQSNTSSADTSLADPPPPSPSSPAAAPGASAPGTDPLAKPGGFYEWNDVGTPAGDMNIAHLLSSDEQARARVIAGSVSAQVSEKEDQGGTLPSAWEGSSADPSNGTVELQPAHAVEMRKYMRKNWKVVAKDVIDRQRVAEITAALEPAFRGRVEHTFREDPSRRFDASRHLQDREDTWRVTKPASTEGRRSVVLMVDSSGSMLEPESQQHKERTPFAYGQELIASLSDLAARKKLDAYAVFHQVDSSSWKPTYNQPLYQVVKLPIPDARLVNFIATGMGEGIGSALVGCRKLLADADFVGMYTDGDFTDGAIDKDIYRSQGIKLHGLFAGPAEQARKLSKFVDYPLIGRNSVELAGLLAAELQQVVPKAR